MRPTGSWSASSRHWPLIKGERSLFGQHGRSAVEDASVLAGGGVHVSGLDHVHWRGDDGGAQACAEGRHKVAGQIICEGGGGQKLRVNVWKQGVERLRRGLLPHLSEGWTWGECPWLNRRSPVLCNSRSHFWQCLEQFLRDKSSG